MYIGNLSFSVFPSLAPTPHHASIDDGTSVIYVVWFDAIFILLGPLELETLFFAPVEAMKLTKLLATCLLLIDLPQWL
jgi:hypothetical protein